MNKPAAASVIDKFNSAIMPVTECGCWIWMGACSGRGYGSIRIGQKTERAHRLAWELFKGPIEDGLHVLHRCDITYCVNPDHLFLGSHQDNMIDKEKKDRGNHASGRRNGKHTKPERTPRGDKHHARLIPGWAVGSANNRAVLADADIISIRKSSLPTRELVRLYKVSRTHIKRIRARKCWTNL